MRRKELIFLLLGIIFSGCDPTISDLELPDTSQRIVINGTFSPENRWSIGVIRAKHVTEESKGSFEDQFDDLLAEVEIWESDWKVATLVYTPPDEEKNEVNGFYSCESYPESGKRYELRVRSNGYPDVSAESTIPTPIVLQEAILIEEFTNTHWPLVKVKFQDQAGAGNYYEVVALTEDSWNDLNTGELRSSVRYGSLFTSDPIYAVQSDPYKFANPGSLSPILFSDEGLDGTLITIYARANISPNVESVTRKYKIILRTLSHEYFEFVQTKSLQFSVANDPFAQPVQVFSNISDGLGIFAGFSESALDLSY